MPFQLKFKTSSQAIVAHSDTPPLIRPLHHQRQPRTVEFSRDCHATCCCVLANFLVHVRIKPFSPVGCTAYLFGACTLLPCGIRLVHIHVGPQSRRATITARRNLEASRGNAQEATDSRFCVWRRQSSCGCVCWVCAFVRGLVGLP